MDNINMTGSESTTVSNKSRLVTYDCSFMNSFMWNAYDDDSADTIIVFIITCASCPFIVLFNAMIIAVIAKKPSLHTNSNILLSSLAFADLAVGAICQPLEIISGAFGFHYDNPPSLICTLNKIHAFVLYSLCWCSLCHLTAIAWERKARISEDLNYVTNVSRRRIKVLIFACWISVLVFVAPSLLELARVQKIYVIILDTIITAQVLVFLIGIVYYYISIFIKTRKLVIHPANENISQIAIAKYEKQVAVITGLLTLVLLICYFPPIVVYIFGYFFPVLHGNSFLHWLVMTVALNSLANPLLYCFRNRRIRKAVIELLRGEQLEGPVVVPVVRRNAIRPQNDDIPLEDLRLP